MKNLSLFEYLAAFVTIVLAIALSDMLMSLHRLLVARARVSWSVIPLAAAVFVLLNLLSEFFSIYAVANVATVSFNYLVLLVSVSAMAAMAAFAVLPDEVPASGLSLWESYLERRTQIWTLMALGWGGDIGRGILAHVLKNTTSYLVSWDFQRQTGIEGIAIVLLVILAWRKERWIHALGIALLFALVGPTLVRWNIR